MEINQSIFTIPSLSIDQNSSLNDSKSIHYALNSSILSHSNAEYEYFLQNVASNKLCFDLNKEILGVIKLDKEEFVIFSKNEIGLFDASNCIYISLVIDSCLKFVGTIRGVYKYGKHGRTIYFIDEKNSLRYYNIDKAYPKKKIGKCNTCSDTYSKRLDCDSLLVWKNIHFPKLKIKKGNGRLPSGKYQVAIALTDEKLRISDYFIYPNIFTVSPYEKSSLNIEFECFETDFEEYELVLIAHREDRGTVAQSIGYFNTAQLNYSINEIDAPSYFPIDTSILFSVKPYYQQFKHIEYNSSTTEGQLVLGGLKERKSINYWKQAFNIVGEWVEVRVPAKESYKLPSALRDEIYSLEIAWLYKDGQISNRIHIPSLVTLKPEWDTIPNNNDTWTDCNNIDRKYWEIYNTAESTGCNKVTKVKDIQVCDYTIIVNGTVQVQLNHYFNNQLNFISLVLTNTSVFSAEKDSFLAYGFYEDTIFTVTENNCRTESINYEVDQCVEEEFIDDIDLCNFKVTNRGKFAYWESQIPYTDHDNFITDKGDFRCKGIRHFKFPDNKISNHHIMIDGKEYVNLLTVQLSNIERPKDCDGNYIEDVVGYIIYSTDRTNHKSILHKGLLSNMWEEDLADCTKSYYANYPFNDLNPDVFLSKTLTHGDIRNSFKPVTNYSKNRFLYTSPDVDYIRNSTGEEIRLYSEETGNVSGSYNSTREFPEIKYLSDSFYSTLGLLTISTYILQIAGNVNVLGSGSSGGAGTSSIPLLFESYFSALKGFLPYDNYGINYLAKGNYNSNNFNNIQVGNIRRKLDYSNYLLPIKQIQDNNKINNYQREQGLYFKLNRDIVDPSTKEYSRVRTKDAGCNDFDTNYVFNPATNQSQQANVASYYTGVKVYKPSQYGSLNNSIAISKYYSMELSNFNQTPLIFMGDVYITKHKKLRKFPFFTNLPPDGYNDVGILQSKIFNIWKPRFYMDYTNKNPIFESLRNFPGIRGIVDIFDKSPFNFEYGNEKDKKNCEDSLNCQIPTTGDGSTPFNGGRLFRNDGSIYTHVIGIQEYWCESEFISDYREVNEISESNLNVDDTSLIKYTRIERPELNLYNLQYLWNGIISNTLSSNLKVNCCCIQNTDYSRIIFSQANNIESQGDKWQSFLPQNYHQFSNNDGELITIHRIDEGNLLFAFENAIYITQSDAGIITTQGMAYLGEGSIFKRRMRKLSDDETGFSGSIDKDSFVNTRYGCFWVDAKRKRFFLYDGKLNDITDGIRSWSNEFVLEERNIKGTFDNFTDTIYWSSNKWTISYKPAAKSWMSFHSFLPDSYLQMSNNFITIKGTALWKHNDKYNYTNYYEKQYPFIVGFTVNNKFKLQNLQSIQLYADFIKEYGFNSKEYTDNFFTKIIAYTNKTSTGLKNLTSNEIDIYEATKQTPKWTRLNEGLYRINNFINQASGQPLTEFNNMDYKFLNTSKVNEGNISGYTHKIHLEYDENLKVLLKLNLDIISENIK